MSNTIRITVVGDGDTGKTCMLIAYKDRKFDDRYIPTIFDSYSMTIPINNTDFNIILSDTAGQEDFDKLRKLAYPNVDIFLLCYSVNNRDSYANILEKWEPELRKFCPSARILLVGTKTDLKKNSVVTLTEDDGRKLSRKIKADGFIENSAKEMMNIDETFANAMSIVVNTRSHRKSGSKRKDCVIT